MQDRSSAGAIATLAILLFLLQGLASGLTHANMAMAALATDDVICSTHMPEGGSGKQDPAGKIAGDCCGTLCRLASATIATLPVTPVERADLLIPTDAVAYIKFDAASPPSPPNLESRPRAPPAAPHA